MLFAVAVLHTFSIKIFKHYARRFPQGSIQENLLHLPGEVEKVLGLWAGVLVACIGILNGGEEAARFVEGANFTEPAFGGCRLHSTLQKLFVIHWLEKFLNFAHFGLLFLIDRNLKARFLDSELGRANQLAGL